MEIVKHKTLIEKVREGLKYQIVKHKTLIEKVREGLKYHLVDTTAILTPTNPAFSAMEIWVSGMTDQVSIKSRLTVAALSYAGFGSIYSKGRDLSRKIFHISDKTKERIQTFHDSTYTFAFNLALMPPIYLLMGSNLKQALIGGVSGAFMGTFFGPVMGYSIDVARDLTGLQDCERDAYPNSVKMQKPFIKKGLAGLLTAGSIAAMAGIYALTPD